MLYIDSLGKLALLVFSGLLIFGYSGSSLAQDKQSTQSLTPTDKSEKNENNFRPATQQDLIQMVTAGGVASCALAQQKKLSFSESLQASAFGVAWVIENLHGSKVEDSKDKISKLNLLNGSAWQMLQIAKDLCYDKLSVEDRKFIDDNYAAIGGKLKDAKK